MKNKFLNKYISKITNYILNHETFDFKEIIKDLENNLINFYVKKIYYSKKLK